tara:strand:- start:168 stop:422 length:255 start_codon:yes stop_codon:yes gene_type:complete
MDIMDTMNPTNKSQPMEDLLAILGGSPRKEVITTGRCMSCKTDSITEDSFRDDLSIKEYKISGMCQKCQDDFFGVSEDGHGDPN